MDEHAQFACMPLLAEYLTRFEHRGIHASRVRKAGDVQDMNQSTFRLHPLQGNRKGVWAVTVRANWRVTFRFEEGDAYDVDLEDYH